jgi:pyridoxal 5'-phosphate synthase pdxS subunit
MRAVMSEIRRLQTMREDEWPSFAKDIQAPLEIVAEVAGAGALPVVNFAAGGVATPADAALMMKLGADGVFVGSGIFKSSDPTRRGRAIVEATTHYQDAKLIAEVSRGLGEPMAGIARHTLEPEELLAGRGW